MTARDPDLIGLFPGSRAREIRKIFPIMIETSRQISKIKPAVRFEVAAASERLAVEIRSLLTKSSDAQIITIRVGETAAMMQRASVGIVASGNGHFGSGLVSIAVCPRLQSFVGDVQPRRVWFCRSKYLGMPNVLADREVVPEFLQHRARPYEIARAVSGLMNDAESSRLMISEFDSIIAKLGSGGANRKAAEAILEKIGDNSCHE